MAACQRLLRVVFLQSHYPLTWPDAPRAWLSGADVLDSWVVERQGEILGHVALSPVGTDTVSAFRWCEMTGRDPADLVAISRLFVRPRVRRQGLGTALLETAVAQARTRGQLPVLQVGLMQREAVRFHEALGWHLLSMDERGTRGQGQRIICYWAPTG